MAETADSLRKGLITPPLVQNTGFGAYTFFAVFCLLSLIWTFHFVPETRGSMDSVHFADQTMCLTISLGTLEAMDHVFKDIISEQEEARRKAIESELMSNPDSMAGR